MSVPLPFVDLGSTYIIPSSMLSGCSLINTQLSLGCLNWFILVATKNGFKLDRLGGGLEPLLPPGTGFPAPIAASMATLRERWLAILPYPNAFCTGDR